jgi:AraC-like DNA-binding protein
MENLPLIEVSDLNRSIVDSDHLDNDFIVADLSAGAEREEDIRYETLTPIRMNALMIVLTLEGSAQIDIDYIPYVAAPNSLFLIMPTHVTQPVSMSRDFKGRIIVASTSFLQEFASDKKMSMTHYMQMKKNPCTVLEPEETAYLDGLIHELRTKVRRRTHFFHREMVLVAFAALSLEVGNIMAGKNGQITMPELSRKEELFEQFLKLLLQHCGQQHSVTFYAEELCITPQYLSLALKSVSGKSANKWIEDALIVEAKLLLRKPRTTIQQVADMLNFVDQSTFGKFFKKNAGLSPSEYRKVGRGN